MEYNEYQVSFYQKLIEVLKWFIDLRRIDIAFEVSALSRYLDFPRTRHMFQALHVLKYL